ncbi:MAG: HYC_CC_PP family protein [Flavipsychrobacter sp.]|nr:hypothetical protein [Chitinophagales bacterium]
MKKLIVIPIMFIYLLAVSGVTISMHYCGSELESWGMYTASATGCESDNCIDDATHNDTDCCKDEVLAAKITVDHTVADYIDFKLSVLEWVLPSLTYIVYSENAIARGQEKPCNGMPNAPPGLWQNIPLFKLHSSFTYYG